MTATVLFSILGYVLSDIPYCIEKGIVSKDKYDMQRLMGLVVSIISSINIYNYIGYVSVLNISLGLLVRQLLEDVKNKEVYELPMIVGVLISIVYNIYNNNITTVFVVVMLLLFVIALLKLYGMADFYGYFICCSFCIENISIINILLLSSILSIVFILFGNISKNKNIMSEKIPLLPVIFISTLVVFKLMKFIEFSGGFGVHV